LAKQTAQAVCFHNNGSVLFCGFYRQMIIFKAITAKVSSKFRKINTVL